MSLLACGGPTKIDGDAIPDIDELAAATQPAPGGSATKPADAIPARMLLERIDMPARRSLEPAWQLVEPDGIEPAVAALWKANGLRIGTIKLAKYRDFIARLPESSAASSALVVTADLLTPIETTPTTRGANRLKLALFADEPWIVEARPGRFQLLLRAMSPVAASGKAAGVADLDLVPHHYFPQPTLQARSPLDAALDGRVFRELALRTRLPADRLLVIGLFPQEAPTVDPGNAAAKAGDEPPAASQPFDVLTAPNPPIPTRTLGELIFHSFRYNRPVQILLILGIQPNNPERKR